MTPTTRIAPTLVALSLYALVACNGTTEAEVDTTTPDTTLVSTTGAPQQQLSRETLLALEKCASASLTSYLWAEEAPSVDRLDEVADLCEEASDQIAVDERLVDDPNGDIPLFQLSLSIWILMIREELVAMTSGQAGNVNRLKSGGSMTSSSIDRLVEDFVR